jgi:hypothetical protein
MHLGRRNVYVKIERFAVYSPLAPITCAGRFGRDCMYNAGHESGILASEILAASLDALMYHQYLDSS